MKLYIVYADYGYEGCTDPLGVFSTREKAEDFLKTTYHGKEGVILECELDEPIEG